MVKEKEIIEDYKKQIKELVDACRRTASQFADPIKKKKVNQLTQLGLSVFKSLEKLEKSNPFEIRCKKCGTITKCSRCGTTLTLV
jgi:hypothetical protein